jgi:hypothetical protein
MLVAAVAMALVPACGGGDDSPGAAESGSGADDALSATLEIITTDIETSLDGAAFKKAKSGQELVVGDRVKTDPTGFAEIAYHDGSWQRVENNATLTVEELAESGDAATVGTSVDVGRTWNRVRELTEPEDAYELETPVATAAVRGTAFSTECPGADECTFKVVDGTVEVTPLGGQPVSLVAPATLTVRRDQPPEEPQTVPPDVLRADPWIQKNLELDGQDAREEADEGGGSDEGAVGPLSPEQVRSASVAGTFTGTRTGVSSNFLPDDANYVEPGSTLERSYEFGQTCEGDVCTITFAVDGKSTSAAVTFDGTTYLVTDDEPLDCLDDATGEVKVPGVAIMRFRSAWTPTEGKLVAGLWTVTAIESSATWSTDLVKPEEFAAEDCSWSSTDGAPYTQATQTSLRR